MGNPSEGRLSGFTNRAVEPTFGLLEVVLAALIGGVFFIVPPGLRFFVFWAGAIFLVFEGLVYLASKLQLKDMTLNAVRWNRVWMRVVIGLVCFAATSLLYLLGSPAMSPLIFASMAMGALLSLLTDLKLRGEVTFTTEDGAQYLPPVELPE